MKKIYLGGKYSHLFALVDDEDYKYLKQCSWHYNQGYARMQDGKKFIPMQQVIMQSCKGFEVDHINRDRLDNRKSNLRVVSRSENLSNRDFVHKKPSLSGYKGVYWNQKVNKFEVHVYANKKTHYVGCFEDKNEAAKAYNEKAIDLKGESAYQNVIEGE